MLVTGSRQQDGEVADVVSGRGGRNGLLGALLSFGEVLLDAADHRGLVLDLW